jgi:hypothetical protein
MAYFAGFVVASLFAMVVSDALDPYGVPPMKYAAGALVWLITFYFVRRTVEQIRPDV